MPEVDVKSMLHQHEVPIVDEVCPNLQTSLALPERALPPRRWFCLGAKLPSSLSRWRKQKVVPFAQTTFSGLSVSSDLHLRDRQSLQQCSRAFRECWCASFASQFDF